MFLRNAGADESSLDRMNLIWLYFELVLRNLAGYPVWFCGGCLMSLGQSFKENVVERSRPPVGGLVQIIAWQFWRLIFRLLSPIMVSGGGFLFLRGLSIKTMPGEKLLKISRRPPVLYLRSFKVDQHRDPGFGARTQEETLAKVLKRVGPCIAVRDPSEKRIFFGFSPLKLEDERWQDRVEQMISESKLVVHCAGGTEGLLWELRRVAELVTPRSKLLVIITSQVTEEWWRLANELLGIQRFKIPGLNFLLTYQSLIYFDEAGQPHDNLIYEVGKSPRLLIEDSLDPLFLQIGVRSRPKFIRWFSDPRHAMIVLLVFFSFLLLAFLFYELGP